VRSPRALGLVLALSGIAIATGATPAGASAPRFGLSGSYEGYERENYTDPKRQVTITVTANQDGAAEPVWEAMVKAYYKLASRSRPTLCKSRM
jgi:hypothetical protein